MAVLRLNQDTTIRLSYPQNGLSTIDHRPATLGTYEAHPHESHEVQAMSVMEHHVLGGLSQMQE